MTGPGAPAGAAPGPAGHLTSLTVQHLDLDQQQNLLSEKWGVRVRRPLLLLTDTSLHGGWRSCSLMGAADGRSLLWAGRSLWQA